MENVSTSSLQALVQLLKYAKNYRLRIILASLCSVINKIFDIAPEILIGIALDVVTRQESSFLASWGIESPKTQIFLLGWLTLAIWMSESLFEYLYLILWRNLAQQIQLDLRYDGYTHIQSQDMSFFDNQSSGELVSILNDDVNQLERFLDGGANELIQVTVSVIAVGGVFIYMEPQIAFFAFLPIPIILWGAFYFQKKAAPRYTEVRSLAGSIARLLANNISGIATIKSFSAELREAQRLKDVSLSYAAANRNAIAVSSAFVPLIRMAVLSGFMATFIVGGFKVLDGTLSIGAYGVLVFLTQRLLWPLTRIATTIDLYERGMASTRRILSLLHTSTRVADEGIVDIEGRVSGQVDVKNLHFVYANGTIGLNNVSFSVPSSTTLAIVGATGSGKSTLIKLLLRFYATAKGSIFLDGHDISELTLSSLRRSIGLVSQDVFLFDGTIYQNIVYGNPSASLEEVQQAAEAAEAWSFITELPQGIETRVGERGVKLSGGQRQRLSLARALLKNPPVLILDEATSAVDNETEAAIQRSLAKVSVGRTVIVIAHRLSTIVHADNIIVLDRGKVLEAGTHDQLIATQGLYWTQWQVQTGQTNLPSS